MNDNMGHGGGEGNLIPMGTSTMGGQPVSTVNLRDLHTFLGVKSEFRNWVKNRIDDFGFVENQDFVTSVEIYRGGERKDYHGTLDMAKELAMVERNEKGKQARLYFIECERRAKEGPASAPNFDDPRLLQTLLVEHLGKRIEAEKRAEIAEKAAEAAAETVIAYDRIAKADGSLCLTDAAKDLQVRPKDLFAFARQNRWIYTRPGKGGDIAYQDKIQAGLLEHKVTTITRTDGTEKVVEQVRVTPKGLAKLAMIVPGARGANGHHPAG